MERASTEDMVKDAIKTLGERGGSSLYNIKKFIEAVYKVDMRYRAPRIRKFLCSAVSDGDLVQTRGRGASGSFKLPPRKQKQPPKVVAAAAAAAPGPSRTPSAVPARPRGPRSRPAPTAATSRARTTATSAASASSAASSAPSSPRTSPSATSVSSASTISTRDRDERARARASRR